MNTNVFKKGRALTLALIALLFVVTVLGGWRWISMPDADLTTVVDAQTDMMLERRISQVEQRFYYIESRLNQLENQTRYPGVLPGATSTSQVQLGQLRTELDTLRAQIDSLRSRVGEVECGLIKVDERTLSSAARQARRQSAPDSSEPCRSNPNSPVRLSARP
jgi:hypothetical protein